MRQKSWWVADDKYGDDQAGAFNNPVKNRHQYITIYTGNNKISQDVFYMLKFSEPTAGNTKNR
jgi:hypothetical protein